MKNQTVDNPSKKSILMKDVSKKKKPCLKNCLMSPFNFDLISIDEKYIQEFVEVLKKSMEGLCPLKLNHPCKCSKTFKKMSKEEKEKCVLEYKNKLAENRSSEEHVNWLKKRKELIIGYNAVMRGLENDTITCLIVERVSKPKSLVKLFIPICSMKSIPMIPIKKLGGIIGGDGMLGVSSCLAIGLTKSALDGQNHFHELYMAACNAHEAAKGKENVSIVDDECATIKPACINHSRTNLKNKKHNLLKREEISKFHLAKLPNGKRAFTPKEARLEENTGNDCIANDGMILVDNTDLPNKNLSPNTAKFKCPKSTKLQMKRKKIYSQKVKRPSKNKISNDLDSGGTSSDSFFVIDFDGDQMDEPKPTEGVKKKQKLNEFPYIPAEVQRVRGDPLRKKNSKAKAKRKV